jgi:hypothetical protein
MRRARPWSSKDDVLLRELAAAGKYVVDIAAEMNRSESVIRTRAKENDLQIAKNTRGRPVESGLKAKSKP